MRERESEREMQRTANDTTRATRTQNNNTQASRSRNALLHLLVIVTAFTGDCAMGGTEVITAAVLLETDVSTVTLTLTVLYYCRSVSKFV